MSNIRKMVLIESFPTFAKLAKHKGLHVNTVKKDYRRGNVAIAESKTPMKRLCFYVSDFDDAFRKFHSERSRK